MNLYFGEVNSIIQIDRNFIEEHTSFNELINLLKVHFAADSIVAPNRTHHEFPGRKEGEINTMLLMPAWASKFAGGIKVVGLNPDNPEFGLPTIQGLYIYQNAESGSVESILDARALTVKRTAAASALASRYLSRKDSKRLLMIGTGPLAENLIRAHCAVRPIDQVYIWGRNFEKAKYISQKFSGEKYTVTPVTSKEEYLSQVDIISCATSSGTPLIFSELISDGQHIDLVGSYKRDMREAEDKVIGRCSIYVDCDQAQKESGDLIIPLENNVINTDSILDNLFALCREDKFRRQNDDELTLFKSVGHALEDLVAAHYFVNKYKIIHEHIRSNSE